MCRYPLPSLLVVVTLSGCQGGDLGPSRAGRLNPQNVSAIVPTGTTAAGRAGDYYLKNDLATFIVQAPGTEIALGPYGGTVVDVAIAGGNDHFGELIPTLALGRTIQVTSIVVRDDGSGGGPAILEAHGVDATNIYYNLQGIAPSLLSYIPPEEGGGGLLAIDPEADMKLSVRIVYTLPADQARLSIRYIFKNNAEQRLELPIGFLLDSRGAVESFLIGGGFEASLSKSFDPSQIADLLLLADTSEQALLVHQESSVGILPRRVGANAPPRAIGVAVPTLGTAILLEATTALGGASDATLSLRPGESDAVEIDILVAERAQDVLERGHDLIGVAQVDVSGCVTQATQAAAGVRVGLTQLSDPDPQRTARGTVATYVTGDDGCFEGRVPPGTYSAIAGTLYRKPSDEIVFTPPSSVELTLDPLGTVAVAVDIFDDLESTTTSRLPCRLTLIGTRQLTSHPGLGDAPNDDPGGPVARLWHTRHCDESYEVTPGRYLAYVSRGPEYTLLETLIEVSTGQTATVSGAIHRVVDSTNYAAADFHVHSVYSPDSVVPAAQRVLSVAAEGLDFWASTDHDVVADYQPHIEQALLDDVLLTVPGVEVTTFDLGHFGAYPVARLEQANGGAPNWALASSGARATMDDLFERIHNEYQALIQVNHARRGGGGVAMGSYFTRAALRYDPTTGMPFADTAHQEVDNRYLRFPAGVSYFSDNFDIIEVMNGIGTRVTDGSVRDGDSERVGHDWMNFLSYGRRIVAVANSDTHTLAKPVGNPRTMVGGHDGGTSGLMAALAKGDAVLTTGPMVRANLHEGSAGSAGLGEVLTPVGPDVTLTVQVETPDWYRVDVVEVLANVFVADPQTSGDAPVAIGPLSLVPEPTLRANGGTAYVATINIPIDLSQPPFDGQDSWLIVRVGGTDSLLYPVMFSGGGTVDVQANSPETFLTNRSGQRPFALTNPIFVDLDGDGKWMGNAL